MLEVFQLLSIYIAGIGTGISVVVLSIADRKASIETLMRTLLARSASGSRITTGTSITEAIEVGDFGCPIRSSERTEEKSSGWRPNFGGYTDLSTFDSILAETCLRPLSA
ncbi:hypothetical protein [Limimaricola pyoseonensis]|uniref:Uncharacterized protein n=1 Tax=Limimaricola pyoseonensis TaxID=521013 RepID=A0A1G7GRU5_9RHOB|nr:hypothetical protein [Limimaricola pyoseonensis]SDE90844.1 hypothetical protein SAMN04488567_2897 [Limimaricola pyoseonensis]